MTMDVSRRSLLALGAGLGASTMLGGSALAKAPKLNTQTPYWHRFVLGDAEVTVVSDGPLPLGPPKGTFVGVPDEEVRKMLSDNFLDPDNVVLEQNSPIVNTGDKLILFDTGMGTSKAFGPTTGRQQKSMSEAGIKPGDIDAVVCSHAHIDHIGGLVGADDKPLFPNAQVYITQSDFDFWTDEGKLGSPLKDFVIHARKNLMPVRDRIVFIKDNQEFLPGVHRDRGPRPHRGPHHLHGVVEGQILRLPRRPHPPPDIVAGKAADAILLRQRSEAGGGHAGETARHDRGQQDPGHVLSLRLARLRPHRQDQRRLPLLSVGDGDEPLRTSRDGGQIKNEERGRQTRRPLYWQSKKLSFAASRPSSYLAFRSRLADENRQWRAAIPDLLHLIVGDLHHSVRAEIAARSVFDGMAHRGGDTHAPVSAYSKQESDND